MSVPFAHIAGIPIEETLGSFGPVLLLALTATTATVRARWRRSHRAGDRRGGERLAP
jgi:hypothetical protein